MQPLVPVVLLLTLPSLVSVATQVNRLPEAWKKQILTAIENFKPSTVISSPPSLVTPTIMDYDPMAFLCPDILL